MAAPTPGGGDFVFDPDARLVNMSVFDLLLIELVPLAERMARAYEASLDRPIPTASTSTSSKRTSRGPPAHSTTSTGGAGAPAITVTSSGTTTTTSPPPGAQSQPLSLSLSAPASNTPLTLLAADGLPSTPIFADSISVRLDNLGFRVGEGLSEKLSRDRARFQNYAGDGSGVIASTVGNINDHQLDVIKFLCKDVWGLVWRKQVDNLKTNHRVRCHFLGLYASSLANDLSRVSSSSPTRNFVP